GLWIEFRPGIWLATTGASETPGGLFMYKIIHSSGNYTAHDGSNDLIDWIGDWADSLSGDGTGLDLVSLTQPNSITQKNSSDLSLPGPAGTLQSGAPTGSISASPSSATALPFWDIYQIANYELTGYWQWDGNGPHHFATIPNTTTTITVSLDGLTGPNATS